MAAVTLGAVKYSKDYTTKLFQQVATTVVGDERKEGMIPSIALLPLWNDGSVMRSQPCIRKRS